MTTILRSGEMELCEQLSRSGISSLTLPQRIAFLRQTPVEEKTWMRQRQWKMLRSIVACHFNSFQFVDPTRFHACASVETVTYFVSRTHSVVSRNLHILLYLQMISLHSNRAAPSKRIKCRSNSVSSRVNVVCSAGVSGECIRHDSTRIPQFICHRH